MARIRIKDLAAITIIILRFAIFCVCQSQDDSDLVVRTTIGTLRGVRKTSISGNTIAFLGIPYAEPPIKRLRFKPAIPKRRMTEEFLADQFGYSCYQLIDTKFPGFSGSEMWNSYNQSEDCLTINIWTPQPRNRRKKLAVMVWIYGGGFFSGSSSLRVYDAAILAAQENVVVVSLNYRVSLFGFLAFGTSDVPGNVGLLDQVLALEWIRDNIAHFGGDENSITLFGESAGAASISYHVVSKESHNLYHRVILQSGTHFSPWAMTSEAEAIRRGLQMAQGVGCVDDDYDFQRVPLDNDLNEIASCLRKKSPANLLEHEWVVDTCFLFPFVPVVDGNFMKELPEETIRRHEAKKVDIMIGINTNEGSFFMPYAMDWFDKDTDSLLNRTLFEKSIENSMPELNSFGRDAVSFMYTDWVNPDNPVILRDNMEAAVSDYNVKCGAYKYATLMSDTDNKVYFYHFNQRAANNPWGEWMGVLHGDEILYVFGDPLIAGKGYSEGDKQVSLQMMRMWANFARTGNPNNDSSSGELKNDWPPFTTTEKNVLRFQEEYIEAPKVEAWDIPDLCAFWNEYLPHLNTQTADIDDAEKKWKEEFHQWSTKYMVDWKAEFNHYVYKKKEKNNCATTISP